MAERKASTPFHGKELHVKMCKKIADLTRVVDKLFRQYYEQCSLVETLRKKQQLNIVDTEELKDENSRIQLEKANQEVDNLKMINRNLKEQLELSETQLKNHKTVENGLIIENNSLKEDIQKLKDEIILLRTEMDRENNEPSNNEHMELIDLLQKQVQNQLDEFNSLVKEKEHIADQYRELEDKFHYINEENESQKNEIVKMISLMSILETEKGELQREILQLQMQIKTLKTHKMDKKIISQVKHPLPKQRREYWLQQTTSSHEENRDAEIQRLKQELQRYRLELTNRESNFNRVFTNHTPVYLKGSPLGKRAQEGVDFVHLPRLHPTPNQKSLRPKM